MPVPSFLGHHHRIQPVWAPRGGSPLHKCLHLQQNFSRKLPHQRSQLLTTEKKKKDPIFPLLTCNPSALKPCGHVMVPSSVPQIPQPWFLIPWMGLLGLGSTTLIICMCFAVGTKEVEAGEDRLANMFTFQVYHHNHSIMYISNGF